MTKIKVQTLEIPNKDRSIYGTIYYPAGSGKHPAVILSHGYNGWGNDFVNECTYYAKNGYIAYAFDFCGGSGRNRSKGLATTEMTIFTEKEDLLAVFDHIYAMDEVDQSRVYLFGGSQGGLVSTLVAEERADQVCAMALYFPALCIPDNWRDNYPTLDNVPETFDFWGLMLGKDFVSSIHDFYTFDHIGKYKGSVYILHGDKDPVVLLSYSERAVELYPHAKLKVMPNEAHGFTPAAGKIAMEEVLAFMEENTTIPYDALPSVPDGYLTAIDQKGTVTTVEYDGTQADGTVAKKTAYVYLPYGYDENKKYDILYTLHGGEGNTKAYLGTDENPAEVKKMLDHMILNQEIKPMIVVAPTYYLGADQSDAVGKIENFTKNELVNELIPAVEGKYSTYAETTDAEGIKASRAHRGYTGFSMGSLSVWRTFLNASDYFYFYMPMSGDCWVDGASNAGKAAKELEAHCVEKGYGENDFLIYAVTGSKDIAYQAMNNQINAMKSDSPSFHFITEDTLNGNIGFHVQPDAEHSYVYLPLYLYNGLRAYFAPDEI